MLVFRKIGMAVGVAGISRQPTLLNTLRRIS